MAEAIQHPSIMSRYFCYHCDREISILPSAQLTCPECSEGFLEEMTDYEDRDDFEGDSVDESDVDESELNLLNLLSIDNLFRRTMLNLVEDNEEPETRMPSQNESNRERRDSDPRPFVEVLSSRHLLDELEESFIHSRTGLRHLGDYLFSDDIDALSTMLLNETEIVGPPPLPKEQIRLLPIVTISKDDVDKNVQCTICMEDFAVREKAKSLPCHHFYHEKCITPWLERHSTCPNCRKSVKIESKSRRSQSCPRTELSLRNPDQRRSSESTSLSGFFTSSRNPFQFL